MSADSAPITFSRFSAALSDLPIDALYSKYAELGNQITHLEDSNKQLEEFARENDDRDCYEALLENRQVMKRFEERRQAIKHEVQSVRGLPWRVREEGGKVDGEGERVNGNGEAAQNGERDAARDGDGGDGVYL